MKRWNLALGIFVAVATCAEAGATTWRSNFECFVKLHYSRVAFGKSVQEVMAHIGVEQKTGAIWMGGSAIAEWANVQDIMLQPLGEAFLGRAVLQGESGKVGPYFQNFVVQYWVRFGDGSHMISPVYPIQVSETHPSSSWDEYNADRATLLEKNSADSAWDGTSCEQIEKISLG